MTVIVNQQGKLMQHVRCEQPDRRVPLPKVVLDSGTGNNPADDARAALEPLREMLAETLYAAQTDPDKLSPLYNVQNLSKGIEAILNNWNNDANRDKIIDALAAQEIKLLNRDGLAKYQIEARFAGLGNAIYSDAYAFPLIGLNDDGDLVVEGLGGLISSLKKTVKAVNNAIVKGVKHKAETVKKATKFVVKNFQKQNPLMITGRTAYRGLVAMNYRGWATIIDNMIKTKTETSFKNKWTDQHIGGNWGDLVAAVNKGKSKKPLLISDKKAPKAVKGLGEAFSAATAVAAATGIITALASYIKQGTDAYNAAKGAVQNIKSVLPAKKTAAPITEILPEEPTPPVKSNKTIWIIGGVAAALAITALVAIQSKSGKKLNGLTIETATIK